MLDKRRAGVRLHSRGKFLGCWPVRRSFSSYDRNGFDDLVIAPAEGAETYITRFDNTDLMFDYTGEWNHNTNVQLQELQAYAVLGEGWLFVRGGFHRNRNCHHRRRKGRVP